MKLMSNKNSINNFILNTSTNKDDWIIISISTITNTTITTNDSDDSDNNSEDIFDSLTFNYSKKY